MNLESAVETEIVSVVESCGFDCYDVKYFAAGGKTILRVFADSDEGISMDDCATISHALSDKLDALEFGNDEYTLEVSSPGLDRPLATQRDFRRFIGKEVQVRYLDETEKQCKQVGHIVSADETTLIIECGGQKFDFLYEAVVSAKLVF